MSHFMSFHIFPWILFLVRNIKNISSDLYYFEKFLKKRVTVFPYWRQLSSNMNKKNLWNIVNIHNMCLQIAFLWFGKKLLSMVLFITGSTSKNKKKSFIFFCLKDPTMSQGHEKINKCCCFSLCSLYQRKKKVLHSTMTCVFKITLMWCWTCWYWRKKLSFISVIWKY